MLSSPEKLDQTRRYELESPANELFLSAISVVELMIKHAIGKIRIEFDPLEMAQETGLKVLSFSGKDAMALKNLPMHHKDPFDRMLIAQSQRNKLALMTDDSKFLPYACKLI